MRPWLSAPPRPVELWQPEQYRRNSSPPWATVAVRAAGAAICVATKSETAATWAGESWGKAGMEMPPRVTMPATRLGNAAAC